MGNAGIRALVPKAQLLDFPVQPHLFEKVAEHGWGPLCRFLNLSVPVVPFPSARSCNLTRHEQEIDDAKRLIIRYYQDILAIVVVATLSPLLCRRAGSSKRS